MLHSLRIIAFFTITVFASLVSAQNVEVDYYLWTKQAKHVERQLEKGNVSESLRKQVADWRTVFEQASEVNKTSIATVMSQIEALGPLPDDGTVDTLNDRREALAADLYRLKAPVAKALEAFKKADGLIKEIDQTIRAKQASALVHLGKSPLNFRAWPNAWSDLQRFNSSLVREISTTLNSANRSKALANQSVNLITRVAISLILLFGAQYIVNGVAKLLLRHPVKRTRLASVALNLLLMVLRVVGLCYFLNTITISGIFDVRGDLLLTTAFSGQWDSLFYNWPLWIFGSIWLGQSLMTGVGARPSNERKIASANGVILFGVLGCIIVVSQYIKLISAYEAFSEQTVVILNFVLILIGAFTLLRLGKINLSDGTLVYSDDQNKSQFQSLKLRLIASLGRLSNFIAVISLLLAAVGFMNASEGLFFSFVLTLALLTLSIILQVSAVDAYTAIYKGIEPPKDALFPILIGFFLFLIALPILALIWGARSVDLVEIWNAFQKGVPIGDARLSPANLLIFIVIFTIGYMATRLLQSALKSSVLPKTKIETGAQTAIVSGIGYLGIFIAAVLAISSAGLDLSSLAIVAGALSVGIGFGLQNIVSNFVSGIILLIERPVSEGDWIEVGGKMGYVRNISVRSTRIETFDRSDVIVPNADLVSGVVTNYTRGNTIGRLIIPVGVAYGTDTRRVAAILLDIIESHPMVVLSPKPSVVFQGFGADSLDFEIRAILRDVNWILSVKSEVNHQIAAKFGQEGIEIPFAQRDIWIRNAEDLKNRDLS